MAQLVSQRTVPEFKLKNIKYINSIYVHLQYSKYANKINLQIKKIYKKRCALHSEQRQSVNFNYEPKKIYRKKS